MWGPQARWLLEPFRQVEQAGTDSDFYKNGIGQSKTSVQSEAYKLRSRCASCGCTNWWQRNYMEAMHGATKNNSLWGRSGRMMSPLNAQRPILTWWKSLTACCGCSRITSEALIIHCWLFLLWKRTGGDQGILFKGKRDLSKEAYILNYFKWQNLGMN